MAGNVAYLTSSDRVNDKRTFPYDGPLFFKGNSYHDDHDYVLFVGAGTHPTTDQMTGAVRVIVRDLGATEATHVLIPSMVGERAVVGERALTAVRIGIGIGIGGSSRLNPQAPPPP